VGSFDQIDATNVVAYSIQISVVPSIAQEALLHRKELVFAASLVQVNPDSLVGYLNGLAYALLGIPSISFGYILFKAGKSFSAFFLVLNGILCILGLIGYIAALPLLAAGTVAGGGIFLFALGAIFLEFRKNSPITP
jgi:hypothetical protein